MFKLIYVDNRFLYFGYNQCFGIYPASKQDSGYKQIEVRDYVIWFNEITPETTILEIME